MNKLIELARQGQSWLQETTWSYLFGIGFFLLTASMLVSIISGRGGVGGQLKTLLLSATFALLLAKLLSALQRRAARLRAAGRTGEKITALVLRQLQRQVRMDRAHAAACVAWLCRRPLAPPAPGAQFTLTRRGSYATVIMMGLLSTFVDLPISTFMASVMTKDPAMQLRIHVVMGVLAVYSLLWLLGDRRLMQGSGYVLGASSLELKIAARFEASMALAAIRRAEAITEPCAAWCERHSVPLEDTLSGSPSPLDDPNVVLTLDQDAAITLRRWQLECPMPRYLFLYVDEPSQFVAALGHATAH